MANYKYTKSPTVEQRNKWEGASNIRGQILAITLLPFPRLGAIVSLETEPEHDKNVYQITMGMLPKCTCPDFVSTTVFTTGGRQLYVNCKHLYYLYQYFYKMDIHDDKFIHAPSYSFNEVKLLLVRAGIIIVSK